MPVNLIVVPQVLPHDTFVEHLDGAFACPPLDVRLFGSLSLARLHPDVTSWSAAAVALGMPERIGRRVAHDCR